MTGDHRCQRSDDAEAVALNVVLFGRFCPSRRAGTYPIDTRVQALRLLGRRFEAQELCDRTAAAIPVQQVRTVSTALLKAGLLRVKGEPHPVVDPLERQERRR